ncbi:MAG: glycosyltransferase, partial [Elusimicrobia bacterium]|nr:glycosyltransferase [Elusimicrobiota bacterium]
ILYLFSTGENRYLNFLYAELERYLHNVRRFNIVEYCHRNGIKNLEKNIMDLISAEKIDIVISSPFATDYQLSVEFYAALKEKTGLVFWMWDDEAYFDVYSKYYSQVADAVISCDYYSVFAYEKFGIPVIFYLPTIDNNSYYPVKSIKDIDVCFIGSCNQNDRAGYINFLIENGINIETFGYGSKNGFVNSKELAGILSRSKIVLNFNKLDKLDWINQDEPLLNKVRQSGGHYCESALTKSFCLAEYTPDLNILAEIGKEIDVFHNKYELLEKIKYYLANDSERETMAEKAYKRAITNCVPEITIPKILKELENILGNINKQKFTETKIFLSKNFKRNSINGLTFDMFVLIKNRKLKYAFELFRELFRYGIFNFIAGFYGGFIRVAENMINKCRKKFQKAK